MPLPPTEWVAGSDGAVLSRSVTSCAGMTAYFVLLAQTRVGFLSGGRGKSFHQLTPQEQSAQKEEAFARATVALTRAQQICMIMGPLDMRGLVGAATIMGCLKYGARIHFSSHGSMIRLPTSCDMSLGMQWMALICRAIFSGLYGQKIIPSGVLMHGKEIGFNWTNVASLPLLELSNFSMPSVLTQNDPGEQQRVRRWVSRQATLQRILISTTRREANSRSSQDAYQLNDGQLQRKAGLMWS